MERRKPAVHRTIVVVDVEGFGDRRRSNPHQLAVRAGLYRALRRAFDDSGVSWAECDREDRGDGVFVLAPAEMPKALFVDSVPHALVGALREHNTTHPVEQRIRLRVALHAGEVSYDEHGVTATSINLAFRLLDSRPVKIALAESPGVLAVITSAWFYDEVVRNSSTDPATFQPVRVAVKETSTTGWICLPDHPYPPGSPQMIAETSGGSDGPIPRQLPAAPRSFIGRTDQLASLTKALDGGTGQPGAVAICAIAGAGGIGKTWLALHWAHENLDRFPDGQLFVDLRGFSPDGRPMAPGAAVRGFLDALGVDSAQIPVDFHTQVARYRSLTAGKRMLILLDNAADATQVTPLLPGSSTCCVLVTSRNHLSGLISGHGARHVPVNTLSDTECRALLTTRLGVERVTTDPEAAEDLLGFCGGSPLALSIIAGRAQTHPHVALATLAAELRDAGLGALDDDDPAASLPTVLSWSYRALNSAQARMFRQLGIAPGPDIGLPAAASLAGLSPTRVRAVLRGLEQVSLIGQDTRGRYRMHDLIRRYASDQAHHNETRPDRMATLRRLIDFYLHAAHAAARILDPHRAPIRFASPPTALMGRLPALSGVADAMQWFVTEHSCLLAAQQAAMAYGRHQAVWQLAWTLTTFHRRQGHLDANIIAWQAGLAAANHLGDLAAQALASRLLGDAYNRADRLDEALEHLQQALTLAKRADDRVNQAHAHRGLVWARVRRGQDRRALEHAGHALRLFRTLDNSVWEADALNAVGWCAARLGDHDKARRHCTAALVLYRRNQNRNGEAMTLNSLGYVAHHCGRNDQAITYYEQALALFRDTGNSYFEAHTLDGIGHAYLALGNNERARAVWREALMLYRAQRRTVDAERVQRLLNSLAQRPR